MNIRKMRENAGYTLCEAARLMGVRPPSFSAWESGASFPTANKLPALAELLDCTIDDLFDLAAYGPEINRIPEDANTL